MSRAVAKRRAAARSIVDSHNATNPYRAKFSNQVGVSGTPPMQLDAIPFTDVQDFNPNSPTFGQFFFMVGFSKVGGKDLIR
jgi:hypothetical protein